MPWLVLAGGLLSTTVVCDNQRRFRQLEHERIESELAAEITAVIQTRLATNQAVLDAVAGLFNASQAVSRQEFTDFFRSINTHGANLKGIQGVGFAAVVPGNAIPTFERSIRADGAPEFQVRPAGARPLTSAIVYLQPDDWRNQRAIGFDMYSESTRRAAMELAASTGEPALSGPVRLVQETDHRPQVGMLLYTPIYRDPQRGFSSSPERMRRLRGWAYSPLRMGDLINNALDQVRHSSLPGAAVLIYDGDQARSDRLLFDNQNLRNSRRLNHPTWQTVQVANRSWLIGIQVDHRQIHPSGWSPQITLMAWLGLSLSGLAALVSQRLVSNHIALRQALEQEQQAARERALAATVFDSSPVAIVVSDADGIVLRVNRAFTQLSGYSEIEARGHKTNLMRSGRHDEAFYRQMWEAIIQKGYWSGEVWNRHRTGQIRRHELNIAAVLDNNDQIVNFVGLLRDVTDRHSQQEHIRHLATHDQLTGLANRGLLMEELNRAIALAGRQHGVVGVLFIDLNGFKPINDRFGHAVGDALLKAVAERLTSGIRASDLVCRQGGDEFVMVIPDAPNPAQLEALARKLQQRLATPYPGLPEGVRISASVGIARWPDHAADADGLLAAADSAMYRAKRNSQDHIASAQAGSVTPTDQRSTRTDAPALDGHADGAAAGGSAAGGSAASKATAGGSAAGGAAEAWSATGTPRASAPGRDSASNGSSDSSSGGGFEADAGGQPDRAAAGASGGEQGSGREPASGAGGGPAPLPGGARG